MVLEVSDGQTSVGIALRTLFALTGMGFARDKSGRSISESSALHDIAADEPVRDACERDVDPARCPVRRGVSATRGPVRRHSAVTAHASPIVRPYVSCLRETNHTAELPGSRPSTKGLLVSNTSPGGTLTGLGPVFNAHTSLPFERRNARQPLVRRTTRSRRR